MCIFSPLLYYDVFYGRKPKRPVDNILSQIYGSSVLSGGTAAVILIPAVSAVGKTTAAKEAGFLSAGGIYGNIWEQLGSLLLDSTPYATNGDQSAINLYCGCAALLFAVLFFLNPRLRWQRKAGMILLLLFYFSGFHFQTLNLLLHGLHRPVGMPNRFAFIFIFLLLNIAWGGLEQSVQLEKKTLGTGVIVCFIFCAAVGINTENLSVIGTIAMVLLYFGVLIHTFGSHRYINQKSLLSILVLCEIGLHGIFSICNNGTANRNLYEASRQELQQIMNERNDWKEYRVDIVNPVLRNEELLYGLNGISMFSSTNTDAMQIWMERMGFETGKNRFQYSGETELTDMLLGVKYLVCRNNIELSTFYKKIHSGKYFDLYENPRALAVGYLVDSSIQNFNFENRNPLEVQNYLVSQIGNHTLYQVKEVGSMLGQTQTGETIFRVHLKSGEHGYLWIPGEEPITVRVNGKIQKSDYWNNNFLDLGYSGEDRSVQVQIAKSHIPKALLGICEQTQLDSIYQELSQNELQMKQGTGTILANKNGVLLFSLFYDEGIRVRVDGKEVQTLDLEGLLGINLTKGRHTVSIHYEIPGFKKGAAISAAAIWILLIPTMQEILGKKRKRQESI